MSFSFADHIFEKTFVCLNKTIVCRLVFRLNIFKTAQSFYFLVVFCFQNDAEKLKKIQNETKNDRFYHRFEKRCPSLTVNQFLFRVQVQVLYGMC